MVKYIPGPFVGQLSGKAGNTVASHSKTGSYLRTRVVPTNPRSARQTLVRNDVQELSQSWKNLTDAQRAGWDGLGAQSGKVNKQGQAYTLSGFQAYLSININLRQLGAADVQTAPALGAVAQLTSVSVTASAA
jgi:hypothetical protein